MSALARYYVECVDGRWRIVDSVTFHPVDTVRTSAVAAYEVDLLNTGRAHVEPAATIGCRVVPNGVRA